MRRIELSGFMLLAALAACEKEVKITPPLPAPIPIISTIPKSECGAALAEVASELRKVSLKPNRFAMAALIPSAYLANGRHAVEAHNAEVSFQVDPVPDCEGVSMVKLSTKSKIDEKAWSVIWRSILTLPASESAAPRLE